MKIVKKVTEGCVVQSFNAETGDLVSQEFMAGTEVEFENEKGLDEAFLETLYHPFDMVQP